MSSEHAETWQGQDAESTGTARRRRSWLERRCASGRLNRYSTARMAERSLTPAWAARQSFSVRSWATKNRAVSTLLT